jgi:hypothetical protein
VSAVQVRVWSRSAGRAGAVKLNKSIIVFDPASAGVMLGRPQLVSMNLSGETLLKNV